ncbi:MAG: adenine phosphoribosyltransferase [Myxococcota bacterium]|nr:adenine phosphoribosyltransferase [Myxococcota bacterium]
MASLSERISATIRDVPDFPKPGILFKDITPVLADAALMQEINQAMLAFAKEQGAEAVVGMESRGFLFGVPLAMELGVPFAPARKPGKLPYQSVGYEYELEYGSNRLELHVDAVKKGQRVLIVDDLLATGGTADATARLVRELGAEVVGFAFLVELNFLEGAKALGGVPHCSLVQY